MDAIVLPNDRGSHTYNPGGKKHVKINVLRNLRTT